MHFKFTHIFLGALLLTSNIKAQTVNSLPLNVKNFTVNNDSLDEEMFLKGDTTFKSRKNIAKQNKEFNAVELENKRYHAFDDTFTKKWYDHLFLQVGAGIEQMVPPAENYQFDGLTTGQIGIGKQFNKYHSLRALINGAFGYQRDKDHFFIRLGGRVDHLFSISSFMDGYNPMRTMDVSTVVGFGYHHSRIKHQRGLKALEAHAGLQFRFFTGPQGYLNIEPYAGIAKDAYDLSESRNWRKYDVFYGANVNFIYYINNNLSKEARDKFLNKEFETMPKDRSRLKSWQSPFFLDISSGLTFMGNSNLGKRRSMGHNMTAAVGKWFSPAIGLRLSMSETTFTWGKDIIPAKNSIPTRPQYTNNMHSLLFGIGAEAMISPLGFSQKRTWEENFGFHFLLGGQFGWLMKEYSNEHLSCHSETYTAAIQLWAKLHEGTRIFIEPRYSRNIYKLPYSNVKWNKRFADNAYNFNIGLSMLLQSPKSIDDNVQKEEFKRFSVGAGGGFTFMSTKSSFDGESVKKMNASVYGIYRIDRYSGVRLGFEYLSLSDNIMSNYTDYNLEYPELDFIPTYKEGLWNRTFHLGMISADYVLNLTSLFTKQQERKWNLDIYAGPTFAMIFGESSKMSKAERQMANHKYLISEPVEGKNYFGLNGGLNLSYRVKNNFRVFASPTFYVFKEMEALPYSMTRDFMVIETINLGVQYNF